MRRIAITLSLVLLATLATSHAQWGRNTRYVPKTDPNAFRITARADLEEALSRVHRLKGQLKGADEEERDFLISNILDLCQQQLNDSANDSGVVVVEHKDLIVRDHRGNIDEDETVYDVAVRWQGAFSAVEQEILSLGARGLELYEEIYGARAAMLLEVAARARDRDELQGLNRRFGLTRAGAEAGTLLAAMLWEEAEVSPCARLLERVLSVDAHLNQQKRAELSAWLAHCYMKLGERASLAGLIERSKDLHEVKLQAGDDSLALGDFLQRRLLETRDGTTDTIDHLGVEWPGGNYKNTGMHEQPTDYADAAWEHTLPPLRAERETRQFMGYESPVVPPHLPVFDGSNMYITNGDTLLAYDLVGSNDGPAWSVSAFGVDNTHNWRTSEPDPGHIMPVSVHRGTVFAALENPLSIAYHKREADRQFRLHSHYPKVHRALCAVDGSTGRLLWKLGGQYEGGRHDTTNFLSSVVHDGVLYAIASRIPNQAEIFLYALDPDTGDIHWNLRLCYGQQETTMFGRPAREPHPSLPAIANGRLYLCTNIGGVVSVELASRSIEWISRYDYMPRPGTKYIDTYYRDVTFYNSPTIYTEHDGRPYILCAPTDAAKMFALDARNGEVLWDLRQDLSVASGGLEGGRALVGVRDGKALVAGDGGDYGGHRSRLYTVAVDTGRIVKSVSVTPKNNGRTLMLSGRPALTTNSLLWPGRQFGRGGSTLAEVNLDTMQVARSVSVPGEYAGLGYSVFAQHGVVFTVAGKDYALDDVKLAARFDEGSLLEVVKREYRSNPKDAEAAVRYGLLMLRLDGNARDEALGVLEKAFELAASPPADSSVRERAGRALVDASLAQADRALSQRSYETALARVADARKFATGRAQLTECFRREEKIILAGSSEPEINAFYRRLIREDPPFGMGENPEIPVGIYCKIRLAERLDGADAVALWQEVLEGPARYRYDGLSLRMLGIEKILALIERHGRQVYDVQESAAKALVNAGGAEDYRRCLEHYPLAAASGKAALELAWTTLQTGEPVAAAEVLRAAIDEYPARPRVNELNALLAMCYARAGETLRARLLAMRTLRNAPDGTLRVSDEEFAFKEVLEPLTRGAAEGSQSDALAELPRQIQQLWGRPWPNRGYVRLPEHPASMPRSHFYMGENSREGSKVIAIDAASGNIAWSHEVAGLLTEVLRTRQGPLLVTSRGFTLYDDDGKEIWSLSTAVQPEPLSLHAGMLVFGARSSFADTGERLVRVTALDASTGGELWESRLDAGSINWIGQSPGGVLVITGGDAFELVLLDTESGVERARTRLSLRAHPRDGATPIIDGDRVLVVDRDGVVNAYALDTLERTGTWETTAAYPLSFRLHDGDFILVGHSAAVRHDPEGDREVWRVALTSVAAHALLDDRVVIGTGKPGEVPRLIAYDLADGRKLFEHIEEREDKSGRLDLQPISGFDGGVVAVYADFRQGATRDELWGFRVIVLNDDGSVRFQSEQEGGGALFVQIAHIDGYMAIACGRSTFGFGRK